MTRLRVQRLRYAKCLAFVPLVVLLMALSSRAHQQPAIDKESAERGKKSFQQACGFCHGPDATGSRAPDLVRSPLVAHDKKGELIGEVIRNGRPDKGMPAQALSDAQIADIASFLHLRALESLESSGVPSDYPVERLLTGNADAGKAYFEGAGGCKNCHSATGDLAGVAKKYRAIELEAHMLYPEGPKSTATVTLASGEIVKGTVVHNDDFMIGVRGDSGWYRSFSKAPESKVKIEIHDPLEAHRKLLFTMTQTEMHNLFAYVNSLK